MATIEIERKARDNRLWAALALLALALLAWWWFDSRDEGRAAGADTLPMIGPAVATVPVAGTSDIDGFLRYVDATSAASDAGPAHDYAADGIRRLAGAVGTLAARDSLGAAEVTQQVEALNTLADRMQADPASLVHADLFRAAAMSSAQLLDDLQRRRFPALRSQVDAVRDAARAIDDRRPLLDQSRAVDAFFERAATAVRAMHVA